MSNSTPFIITPSSHLLVTYPHLQSLAQQLTEYYSKNCVTEEHLKTIGLALWQVLSIDATLPSKNIVIKCHGNAIDNLPWECLYHPKLGFLAKHLDYTLSRYVENNSSDTSKINFEYQQPLLRNPQLIGEQTSPPKGPLNILLITAQPENLPPKLGPLEIEIEQQTVYQSLTPFINAGQVHFYAPNDGRFSTYIKLLQRQTWHLVILNGHGLIQKNCPNTSSFPLDYQSNTFHSNQEKTTTFFIFENDSGESELIAGDTLAQVFQKTNVQCVVVAACQSARFLEKDHLIMPILKAGVPYIVGMREALIDRAGTVFVKALCIALAQKMRIDVAVQTGRQAMTQLLEKHEIWRDIQGKTLSNDPTIGQWCLPILISHAPTRSLVNWDFSPKPRFSTPISHEIIMPKIFIGRRRELRILEEALSTGKIQRLLIRGTGGLGKTALVGRLAITLAQQGYRIFTYQIGEKKNFISMLVQALNFTQDPLLWEGIRGKATWDSGREGPTWEEIRGMLTQQRWLLWLDGLEKIQNPHNHLFTDITLQTVLEKLSEYQNDNLRIVLTSRWTISESLDFHDYRISQPKFHDFSRYLKQLGLNYDFSDRLKIYHSVGGNFQGIQLLHSLCSNNEASHLNKNLAIVQRYLSAYIRSTPQNIN